MINQASMIDLLKRLLITLLFSFINATSFAADSVDGLNAFEQGDYQTAVTIWQQAAQQGDSDASYRLAEMYRLGQGVDKNNLTAETFYLQAAQANHVLAQLNLARLYYFGALGPDQKDKAIYWVSKAAKRNNADAQWMLGGMLFNAEGNTQDSVSAYSWLTLAREQNHLQAALDLAKIKPYLTIEQLGDADKLTAAFKANNNAQAVINQQEQEAFYWFHKAAQQQDAHAQWMVGKMYLEGQGVTQDKVAAYSWLTLANEQHYANAGLRLAQLKAELSPEQISRADSLTLAFKQQGATANIEINHQAQATKNTPDKTAPIRYRVQVASFTSQLDVEIELIELKKRFPELMAEQSVTVTEPAADADAPDYYRIQLGAFENKADAKHLCQQFNKSKQACFVVRVKQ